MKFRFSKNSATVSFVRPSIVSIFTTTSNGSCYSGCKPRHHGFSCYAGWQPERAARVPFLNPARPPESQEPAGSEDSSFHLGLMLLEKGDFRRSIEALRVIHKYA